MGARDGGRDECERWVREMVGGMSARDGGRDECERWWEG